MQLPGTYYIVLKSYNGPNLELDATRTVTTGDKGDIYAIDEYTNLETMKQEKIRYKLTPMGQNFHLDEMDPNGVITKRYEAIALYCSGGVLITYFSRKETDHPGFISGKKIYLQ